MFMFFGSWTIAFPIVIITEQPIVYVIRANWVKPLKTFQLKLLQKAFLQLVNWIMISRV